MWMFAAAIVEDLRLGSCQESALPSDLAAEGFGGQARAEALAANCLDAACVQPIRRRAGLDGDRTGSGQVFDGSQSTAGLRRFTATWGADSSNLDHGREPMRYVQDRSFDDDDAAVPTKGRSHPCPSRPLEAP